METFITFGGLIMVRARDWQETAASGNFRLALDLFPVLKSGS